jgi:hypothetical protein
MCSAALGIAAAYRTLFTVSTPGYDNIWTMASNPTVRTKLFTVFRIQYFLQHVPTKPGHLQEIHKTYKITGKGEVSSSIPFYILYHVQNEMSFIFMSLYGAAVLPSV